MLFERKTRDRNIIHFIWLPFVAITVFLVTASAISFEIAFYLMGCLYLVLSVQPILTFWRTRNNGFIAVMAFMVFTGLVCVSAPTAIRDKENVGLLPILLVGMYASMIVTFILTFNRKLRWRGQEIFELAAISVEDLGDSFSPRPRPVGNMKYSKTEMIRFVEFMRVNLVAFVFEEDQRIYFVLALPGNDLPYLLGIKQDYQADTWVAVDLEGNISVNITEKDYLLFKKDLDFDQIAQSLGNVFIEFMSLTQEGKERQILDQMNALRLNPLG